MPTGQPTLSIVIPVLNEEAVVPVLLTRLRALAASLGLTWRRIQFVADLLPGDILGTSVLDPGGVGFRFHPGPIFAGVVLADELNRASPRTQSALLEAMEEGAVSDNGVRHALPEPFFVIATQNPREQAGTWPLPESQLDRFLMAVSLGYPDRDAERELLAGVARGVADRLPPVLPVKPSAPSTPRHKNPPASSATSP
jgi:MoxR-like ATPase